MKLAPVLGLSLMVVLCRPSVAADVVGFKTSFGQAYVAVRGWVPANTTIYGIQFYSNDQTVFPEVLLASELEGGRLPRIGVTLRSVAGVAGQPGYTTAAFEPYRTDGNGFVWLVLRFPRELIAAVGLGGGAGVGWTRDARLSRQRSFYCVDGNVGEFTEALDISLITERIGKAAATPAAPGGGTTVATGTSSSTVFFTQIAMDREGSGAIDFHLSASGNVTLRIFDVMGRRVRTLVQGMLPTGVYERRWDGRNVRGDRVASGIYFVVLSAHGTTLREKVLVMR